MAVAERKIRPPAEQKAHVISEDEALSGKEKRAQRIRTAAESLLEVAQSAKVRLPMLPETASEAMALANDPSTPMNKLERVIIRDAVLASRMLAVASSSAYAGSPVRSLNAALQRLGTGAIRDILYQSVMECHVFRGDDERAARNERDHAVAVGRLTKAICRQVGIDQDYAFVCGLLHDVGRLALQVLASQLGNNYCDPADRDQVHEVVHTTLGALLGTQWKLPALAIEAIRRHHKYSGFGANREGYSQIGHTVSVADRVVCHLGIGREPRALDDSDLEAIAQMGCDPANLIEVASAALA